MVGVFTLRNDAIDRFVSQDSSHKSVYHHKRQSTYQKFEFFTCTLNMATVNADNGPSGSSPPSEAQGTRNVVPTVLTALLAPTATRQDDGSPTDRNPSATAHSTAVTPAGGSSDPASRSPTQDSSRDGSNERTIDTASRHIQRPPGLVRVLGRETAGLDEEDSEDDRKPAALDVQSTSSEDDYLYDDTYSSEYVIQQKIGVPKPMTEKVDRSVRHKRRCERIAKLQKEPPKKKVKGEKNEFVPTTFEEALQELANKKKAIKALSTRLHNAEIDLKLSDRVSYFQVQIANDQKLIRAKDVGMEIYRRMRDSDLCDDENNLSVDRINSVKELLEDISRKYINGGDGMTIEEMEEVYKAEQASLLDG